MPVARKGLEVQLASRPRGEPSPDNFRLTEMEVAEPRQGEVLVRNLYMSVDPYMRGRMNDMRSYAPPYALDQVMYGGAVGEVIESNSSALGVGESVLHNAGWRELTVGPAELFQQVDPTAAPLSRYLGILGMTGLTAYVGLLEIAEFKPPDVVFVSAAAGAVGSAVGQMARLLGAERVIGSAGSEEKVSLLSGELGFDAAFNYHSGPVSELLAAAAPEGIDVYFDNVGGEHLEAAMASLRNFGRVAACGAISVYNATEAPRGPRNMAFIVGKRLRIRGFIVSDHAERRAEFIDKAGGWLREGVLQAPETVVDGLENAAEAFIGMLRGEYVGKVVVRIGA
jgi:NADPH-dependent curcumin reductase CurA